MDVLRARFLAVLGLVLGGAGVLAVKVVRTSH